MGGLTSGGDEKARVVEEQVPEGAALRGEPGLTTQAGWGEPRENHQGPEGSLALPHRHRRARHCF